MGAATTSAIGATRAALASAQGIDLDTASQLFAAARIVAGSKSLAGALADPSASVRAREQVVADVFGAGLSRTAAQLLSAVVSQRWSSAADMIDGIEELAVRSAVVASPDADVEAELFAVTQLVASNAQLELALGSRLGDSAVKGPLVETLLGGRTSPATTLIVSELAQQSRERRVRQLLARAARIAASQRGTVVATVHSAVALTDAQIDRLSAALSARYGANVTINTVLDPSIVGGLRVQIADDVIDGSVSSRLADLRNRLAG